jgi:predicted nucleotidyltransferase
MVTLSLAQSLNPKKIDPSVPLALAANVAAKIRTATMPERIILFGSAAEGTFKVGSDLDVLLVFADLDALNLGRGALRSLARLQADIPIDLVFVTADRFDQQKDIGGVCFIAYHEGIEL